jgi:uncharacterized protein YkwD
VTRVRLGRRRREWPPLSRLVRIALVLACAAATGGGSFEVVASSAAAASVPEARALDGEERFMVGKLNELRASQGAPPLQISQSLSTAASDYAYFLDGRALDHYADGNWEDRARRAGWPVDEDVEQHPGEYIYCDNGKGESKPQGRLSENLFRGSDGGQAPVIWWNDSPGHRGNMLCPGWTSIGVGRFEGTWVAVFGPGCPTGHEGGCALTGDYGDPTPPEDEASEGTNGVVKRKTRLRVGRPVLSGRRLRFSAQLVGGQGKLRVRVSSGGRSVPAHRCRRHRICTHTAQLTRPGLWKVTLRVTPERGWTSACSVRWIRAPRRATPARSWLRASARYRRRC